LRTMTRKVPLAVVAGDTREQALKSVENFVRENCDGYSGADLAALVREAGVIALKRTLGMLDALGDDKEDILQRPSVFVESGDFIKAQDKVNPSVSAAQRRKYELLRSKLSGLPVRIGKEDEKRVDDKTAL